MSGFVLRSRRGATLSAIMDEGPGLVSGVHTYNQWHLKSNWHTLNLSDLVIVSSHVYQALQWWMVPGYLMEGFPS